MEKLKALIEQREIKDYSEWFYRIADLLMRNYLIATRHNKYRITEIEFYYYNPQHKDETTYGFIREAAKYSARILRHKKAQHKPLTWFFHYSGLDLVIGKEGEPGGVLIRGIQNINDGQERFVGPLVVLLELLNQETKADGSKPTELSLLPCDTIKDFSLKAGKRIGLAKGEFSQHNYNYTAIKHEI